MLLDEGEQPLAAPGVEQPRIRGSARRPRRTAPARRAALAGDLDQVVQARVGGPPLPPVLQVGPQPHQACRRSPRPGSSARLGSVPPGEPPPQLGTAAKGLLAAGVGRGLGPHDGLAVAAPAIAPAPPAWPRVGTAGGGSGGRSSTNGSLGQHRPGRPIARAQRQRPRGSAASAASRRCQLAARRPSPAQPGRHVRETAGWPRRRPPAASLQRPRPGVAVADRQQRRRQRRRLVRGRRLQGRPGLGDLARPRGGGRPPPASRRRTALAGPARQAPPPSLHRPRPPARPRGRRQAGRPSAAAATSTPIAAAAGPLDQRDRRPARVGRDQGRQRLQIAGSARPPCRPAPRPGRPRPGRGQPPAPAGRTGQQAPRLGPAPPARRPAGGPAQPDQQAPARGQPAPPSGSSTT